MASVINLVYGRLIQIMIAFSACFKNEQGVNWFSWWIWEGVGFQVHFADKADAGHKKGTSLMRAVKMEATWQNELSYKSFWGQ